MSGANSRRLLGGVLAVALALSSAGCDTMGPLQGGSAQGTGAALTPAEQQMRQDQDRFNQTVLGGVLTGAVVGGVGAALIAKLTGGDSRNVRNSALAGAAVGGAIGGVDAHGTATKEQAGRDSLRATQAATEEVRQANGRLQAFIDSSDRVLAEGKSRLAALRGDVAARKLTAEQAERARKREEQNIESMKKTLEQARKSRAEYAAASGRTTEPTQNKRDLDAEISRMDAQIGQLQNNITQYSRALAVSRA